MKTEKGTSIQHFKGKVYLWFASLIQVFLWFLNIKIQRFHFFDSEETLIVCILLPLYITSTIESIVINQFYFSSSKVWVQSFETLMACSLYISIN